VDGQVAGTPKLSFGLGFLLLGVFPTDILTSWAVGTYLSNHGDPWWHLLPFLLLTVLLLALPAILILLLGQRAPTFPAEGTRVDDHKLVDRQRDRDRLLRRCHGQQPRGIAAVEQRFHVS
jgi:hypothetical protein